jgi:hypothetical protein
MQCVLPFVVQEKPQILMLKKLSGLKQCVQAKLRIDTCKNRFATSVLSIK